MKGVQKCRVSADRRCWGLLTGAGTDFSRWEAGTTDTCTPVSAIIVIRQLFSPMLRPTEVTPGDPVASFLAMHMEGSSSLLRSQSVSENSSSFPVGIPLEVVRWAVVTVSSQIWGQVLQLPP